MKKYLPTVCELKLRLKPTQTCWTLICLAIALWLLQLLIVIGTNRFDVLSIKGVGVNDIYYALVAFVFGIIAYADDAKIIARIAMAVAWTYTFKVLWHPILDALPASPFGIHDSTMVAFEQSIGFSVANISNWAFLHPSINAFFVHVYNSITLALIALALLMPVFDRNYLSNTIYRLAFCVTIGCTLAYLYPVITPYYGYHGVGHYLHDAIGYSHLFYGVREGSQHYVTYDVSLPSFHIIFALLVAKSITDSIKHPLGKVAYIYVGLVTISVFTTGWHYLLDVIVAFIVFYFACVLQSIVARSTPSVSVWLKTPLSILLALGLFTNTQASTNLSYLPDTVKTFAATQAGKKAIQTLDQSTQRTLADAQHFADSGKLAGLKLNAQQLSDVKNISNNSKAFIAHHMMRLSHRMFPTDNGTHLYYFLSFSMPMNLMRVYLHDAVYDGGIIVFRGIGKKDTKLIQFLNRITNLIGHGIAYPLIEIYPQLFDQYDVQVVPTIVLSTQSPRSCIRAKKIEQGLMFGGCQKADANSYWKISGMLSSYFALSQFADAHAPATLYLKRLENGGITSLTCRVDAGSAYDKLPTPFSRSDVQDMLSKFNIHLDKAGRMVGN